MFTFVYNCPGLAHFHKTLELSRMEFSLINSSFKSWSIQAEGVHNVGCKLKICCDSLKSKT